MFYSFFFGWLVRFFFPEKEDALAMSPTFASPDHNEITETRKVLTVNRNSHDLTSERVSDILCQRQTAGFIYPGKTSLEAVSVVIATPHQLGFRGNNTYSFIDVLRQGMAFGFNTCHESTQEACVADVAFVREHGDVLHFARVGREGEVSFVVFSNSCQTITVTPIEGDVYTVGPHTKIVFEVRT